MREVRNEFLSRITAFYFSSIILKNWLVIFFDNILTWKGNRFLSFAIEKNQITFSSNATNGIEVVEFFTTIFEERCETLPE